MPVWLLYTLSHERNYWNILHVQNTIYTRDVHSFIEVYSDCFFTLGSSRNNRGSFCVKLLVNNRLDTETKILVFFASFLVLFCFGINSEREREKGTFHWRVESIKQFITKPPYILARGSTPRFTVIKYRVSSPSGKRHPSQGDTSRVRLLILRQGNKWSDREYEY